MLTTLGTSPPAQAPGRGTTTPGTGTTGAGGRSGEVVCVLCFMLLQSMNSDERDQGGLRGSTKYDTGYYNNAEAAMDELYNA